MENKTHKFLSNKPDIVKFKFDSGLEKDGQWGKYFSFGVSVNKEEVYISASEELAKMIHSFGPLSDKSLIIEKQTYLDDGSKEKTRWIVTPVNGKPAAKPVPPLVETPPPAKGSPSAQPSGPSEVDIHKSIRGCIKTVVDGCEEAELGKKYPGAEINTIINTLFMEISKRNAHGGNTKASEPQKREFEIRNPGDPITEPQLKRIFALMKDRGVSDERVKAHIMLYYKAESRKDLTKGEASKLMDWIEKQGKEGAPGASLDGKDDLPF